jgi:hypothetical protein
MKKTATILFVLLFLATAPITVLASSTPTLPTIRIMFDGSIFPANVPIQRNGDVYTFTDNVYGQIVVDRDNIVIDGAGHSLQGTRFLQGTYNGSQEDLWLIGEGQYQEYNGTVVPWTVGIDIATKTTHNLTVKNLNIQNFSIGIYIWTPNNTITGCAVSDTIVGILLAGDYNTITNNYIAHNVKGIFFGVTPLENETLNIGISGNSFVENDEHFSGCVCEGFNITEPIHTWDDGEAGNFWSDYNGADVDDNGIGDTPYVIDSQNQDRYPLMQILATPPTPKTSLEIIIAAIALPIIIVVAAVIYRRRKKKAV